MNNGWLFFRRLAWSAGILALHDVGTNDAPVRLRRAYPYRPLIDELQRCGRHTERMLSVAWTLRGGLVVSPNYNNP